MTLPRLEVDLDRFTTAGFGQVFHPPGGLAAGDMVEVVDPDGAGTLPATVVEMHGDHAVVRLASPPSPSGVVEELLAERAADRSLLDD